MDEDRRTANENAIAFLRDVAACKVALEQPETASEEVTSRPPSPSICRPRRKFDRCDQEGI